MWIVEEIAIIVENLIISQEIVGIREQLNKEEELVIRTIRGI